MSQNKQRIIAIVLFVILLVALPVILQFGVKQQQNTHQNASTNVWAGGKDTCGHIQVSFEQEIPQCPNNTLVTDSYQTVVRLKSLDGGTYKVDPLFESFWCKDSSELGDGVNPASCIKRRLKNTDQVVVAPGDGTTVTSVVQKASLYGFSSCGIYQTDFSFVIDGTSCRFGYSALDPSSSHPVLAAGYCNTNAVCSAVTVSPTPTPGVSDTPTPTPTPEITDTPTPTPTPGITVTPTDTPVPTGTPMPPTDTPTPGPTTIPTPRPSLPPTGPGDTIVGIGLAGAAAAVIGTLLFLGL